MKGALVAHVRHIISITHFDWTIPMSATALRPRRRKATVSSILGELLLTAGVFVLLFLGWQAWFNSLVLAGRQTSAATEQSHSWLADPTPLPPHAAPTDPPVMDPVGPAQPLAVIYIPRLGEGWKRIIRETVDVESVLNSFDAGVGHYPGTAMPGQIGNFAIAGHDSGWGNTFIDLAQLQLGDQIYVQNKLGWYTYTFRNFQYVQPRAVDVLLPVPASPGTTAADRLITITTCNPPFHAAERLIAYGTFESWQPPSDIPAPIASIVTAGS
jgi:sortase A